MATSFLVELHAKLETHRLELIEATARYNYAAHAYAEELRLVYPKVYVVRYIPYSWSTFEKAQTFVNKQHHSVIHALCISQVDSNDIPQDQLLHLDKVLE